MKVKKQYSISSKVAIAIDVEAAKKQISASSIVEKALSVYLGVENSAVKQPA